MTQEKNKGIDDENETTSALGDQSNKTEPITIVSWDSILDPVNIILKQMSILEPLKNLDSDLRVIYFSEVLGQSTFKKYIICFYTKMNGKIKYLGIEFLLVPDSKERIFIENSFLVQNLKML